jgi:predicted Holliday junction resolvase-like endonuclease
LGFGRWPTDEDKIRAAQHAAEDKIPEIRKEAKREALRHSRAGLGRIVSEEVAPLLHDFPGKASEARFIGKPIDYLIFKGMDEKNVTEVVFVEVKSGTSRLNDDERPLRDAIIAKNVRWVEFHVPDGMVKREDAMPDVVRGKEL